MAEYTWNKNHIHDTLFVEEDRQKAHNVIQFIHHVYERPKITYRIQHIHHTRFFDRFYYSIHFEVAYGMDSSDIDTLTSMENVLGAEFVYGKFTLYKTELIVTLLFDQ